MLLMENFINGIIDAEEFSDDFFVLDKKTLDAHKALKIDFEKLEDFQPDLRSKGFCSFISFLRRECEAFEDDYTEDQFRDSIEDVLFQMQKYFDGK
jgi:hypothetical protein